MNTGTSCTFTLYPFYKIHIHPYNCVEPETAIITRNDITHDSCVGAIKLCCQRLKLFFYGQYYRMAIYLRDEFFILSSLVSISANILNLCVLCRGQAKRARPTLLWINGIIFTSCRPDSPTPLALEIVKAEGCILFDESGKNIWPDRGSVWPTRPSSS